MRIGILGSGLMGGKLGTLFARAGHEVVFSYARSEQKLKSSRATRGAMRGPARRREAARDADALLLAVHWSRVDDVLKQAGDLSGKVIVTCSLPMNADDTRLVDREHLVGRGGTGEEGPQGAGSSPRSARCRARCCSTCSRRGGRRSDRAWSTAATTSGPRSRGEADPRRRVRSGRRRPAADRAVPGAVHAAHRAARVRGRLGPGAGVSLRAIPAVTEAAV